MRDQRVQALALRNIGLTYDQIASSLEVTRRYAQVTSKAGHPTPSKRSSRPSALSLDQVQILIEFVRASFKN